MFQPLSSFLITIQEASACDLIVDYLQIALSWKSYEWPRRMPVVIFQNQAVYHYI